MGAQALYTQFPVDGIYKEVDYMALSQHVLRPIFRHFMPRSQDMVVHTPPDQLTEFFYIGIKHLLIQGAYPLDSNLITQTIPYPVDQFQGGYRCFHEIVVSPAHGEVKISWDRLGFEYRPPITYRGGDSFSYKLRTVTGQESNVACVALFVRV